MSNVEKIIAKTNEAINAINAHIEKWLNEKETTDIRYSLDQITASVFQAFLGVQHSVKHTGDSGHDIAARITDAESLARETDIVLGAIDPRFEYIISATASSSSDRGNQEIQISLTIQAINGENHGKISVNNVISVGYLRT